MLEILRKVLVAGCVELLHLTSDFEERALLLLAILREEDYTRCCDPDQEGSVKRAVPFSRDDRREISTSMWMQR